MGKLISREELESVIGTRNGKLVIVKYLGHYIKVGKKKQHWFLCQCDCGNIIEVSWNYIKTTEERKIKSCGCARSIHGFSKHPVYIHYKCMMARVHRPDPVKHKQYILNNIGICEEWDGHPENFCKWAIENGFEEGLTLDRIDGYKDYSPENCRWVTPAVQANNRPTYNRNITFNGKTQSIAMWARELGMSETTLRARLDERHMPVEKALTIPVQVQKKGIRKQCQERLQDTNMTK